MRIGELDIRPVSGTAGSTEITIEQVSVNDELDKTYLIGGVVGDTVAELRVNVSGLYEELEASDGILTDANNSDLWVPKQAI